MATSCLASGFASSCRFKEPFWATTVDWRAGALEVLAGMANEKAALDMEQADFSAQRAMLESDWAQCEAVQAKLKAAQAKVDVEAAFVAKKREENVLLRGQVSRL